MGSFENKKIAKKKQGEKANPAEAYGKKPSDSLQSGLDAKSRGQMPEEEALRCGYSKVESDEALDPFDNERNVDRVKQGQKTSESNDGPKTKQVYADGEKYH